MKRIDQLTFTRFIAILIVLFFHGGGGIYYQAVRFFPFSVLLTSATTSVTYLYSLSGFVMALAHYRPNEKLHLEEYWKARFVRLYPLYIAAFLLTCYYYGITPLTARFKDALANVFVVQAWIPKYAQSYNFPSWSVTVEMFFYAVFPILAWWASRQSTRKLIWFSLSVWAVSQFIHNALWIGFFPAWMKFLVYFPLFHLSSFILGVTGGIWYLREGRRLKINPRVNILFLVIGVALTSAYVMLSSRVNFIPHGDQLMAGMLAPFLTLSILALSLDETRVSALLKHPALIALGESSYAIYILHIPIKWIYERALNHSSIANPQIVFDYTYLPLMIVIGFLIAFYIDLPFRAWLKKILQRVSLLLLLLDLALLSFSIYLSFHFRFETMRTRDSHYSTFLLMYWSAFVLRVISSIAFKSCDPSILYQPLMQFLRPVLVSVTLGSALMAAAMYAGYSLKWVAYFPLSVIVLDWAAMLAFSLLARYFFRLAGAYRGSSPL